MRSSKLPIFIKSFSWVTAFCLATPSLFATTLTVSVPGDGLTGSPNDLRGVLNQINTTPGTYNVVFTLGGTNTITLGAMLPILNLNAANTITMDGTNGGTQIVIDGASTFNGFFAEMGTISLQNLTIQNVTSTGGAGGPSAFGAGGGALGAGAGLFIDQAAVTLSNVTINNASAVGGAGGAGGTGGSVSGGAGGGGMFKGLGGNAVPTGGHQLGGAGGGGMGGTGGSAQNFETSSGGGGINTGTSFTGAGGAGGTAGPGNPGLQGGGIGGAAGGAGGAGQLGAGGAGGSSGGGGGGGGEDGSCGGGGGIGGIAGTDFPGLPGAGGFGGGGGGGSTPGAAGANGGFGGGGGGYAGSATLAAGGSVFGGGGGGGGAFSSASTGGTGGFGGGGGGAATNGPPATGGLGGVGGGQGSSGGGGGGGAGFGGAIFVNAPGSLTVTGALTSGTNTTTGGAGSGTGVQGWTAGNYAFFRTGSTNTYDPNGSTITISSSIADDSAASFVGAPAGVTVGSGAGANLNVGQVSSTAGTLILGGTNTYSGVTNINQGTLTVTGSILSSVSMNTTGTLFNVENSFTIKDFSGVAGTSTDLFANTLTFGTSTASVTYAGSISGTSGSLTKQGTGIAILSAANSYTGGTTFNQGTLGVGTSTSLGSGTLTFATNSGNILQAEATLAMANPIVLNVNGTVDTNGFNLTLSGGISGAGSLTKISLGTLLLPNANTYGGGTNLNQDTINVGNNTSLGTGTLTFQTNTGNVLQSGAANLNLANAIVLTTSGTADTNGNTMTLSGGISGAGALTKISAGTLALSNANTYGGGTNLNQGTINVGSNTSLGTGTLTFQTNAGNILQSGVGGLSLANLIVLSVNGSVDTNGNSMTLSGGISGAGTLTKIGTGTLVLTGTNTYGGGTAISAGTLQANTTASLPSGGNMSLTGSGVLILNAGTGTFTIGDLTGTSGTSIHLNSDPLVFGTATASTTFAGNISGTAGSLTKQGSGTAIFSGTNSYADTTIVSAGTLEIDTINSLPDVNVSLSGATAVLNLAPASGAFTIADLTGVAGSNLNLGTSTLTFGTATASTTFSGSITGTTATLTKDGTGAALLLGTGTFTGGTTLNQGTLGVGTSTSLGSGTLTFATNSGNILQAEATLAMANPIVLNVNGTADTNGFNLTLSGGISGAGSLTKISLGTLLLPNANTYGGGTNLNQGTINVGNNTSLGTGTLTFQTNTGNVLQSGAANLNLANTIVLTTSGTADTNGNTMTLSGGISGAGALTKISAGTLALSHANTYGGGTNLNQGTINVGNNTSLGAGTLTFESIAGNILQSGAANLNLANAIVLTTSGSVDTNGNTMTLSGGISGTGVLTKIGVGTLILPNANTYNGGTGLSLGTVQVGNSTSLGAGLLTFETNSGNTLRSGAANLNLANSILMDVNGFADTNGNTFTLSGAISGPGILTIIGGGTLSLPNANTYTGGTDLSAGTALVGDNGSLGSGQLTFETNNGNTLKSGAANLNLANNILMDVNGFADTNGNLFTLSGAISGPGILTIIGGGTLALPNANSGYSAGIDLSNGTVQVGNNTSLGSGLLTFETNNGNTLQSGAANLNLPNNILMDVNGFADTNGNTFTLSGGLSGPGILTIIGGGTLVLPNANSGYSAGMDLSSGTVQVGNNTSLGSGLLTFETNNGNTLQSGTNNLNVANNILMDVDGFADTNGNTFTLSGAISGPGILTIIGGGTLVLPNANSGYSAGMDLSSGTVQVGNNTSLGSGLLTFETNNGNTLLSGAPNLNLPNNILMDVNGFANTNGNTFTLSGAISGPGILTIIGGGTLVLPNANGGYSAGMGLSSGTVRVGNNTSLGTGLLTFETNNGNILQSGAPNLDVQNNILLNTNGVADSNGNTFTLSGNTSGPGSLTKIGVGTLLLTGTNAYTGGTDVNAGTLKVNTAGSLPSSGGVTIASGATLDLSSVVGTITIGDLNGPTGGTLDLGAADLTFGTSTPTTDFEGNISGTGTIIKQGSGTAILSGANSFSGIFDVNAGTLNLTGSLATGSTMNIASGATLSGTGTLWDLNIHGNVSPGNSIGTIAAHNVHFFSGSDYILEISNTASDLITASGTLTIDPGSTITVTPLGLTTPLNSYTILTSASPIVGSGNFTLVNSLPRFTFALQYTPNDVFLTLGSVNAFTATGNAAGVAKAFNVMLETNPNAPGLQEVVTVLSAQTQSQLQNSFNQMQPANMDDLAFAEENVAVRVRQTFTERLFEQRVEACPDQEPWRVWIVPFVEHVHQRGRADLKGYKENFRGFSTGLDYKFQDHWAVTTGFSFADSNVSIVHGNAHGSFKTYAGTIGAIWTDFNFFIDGLVSYLYNTVDGKRKMRFSATGVPTVQRKAHHNQNTNEVMGHIGGGYDWKILIGKRSAVNIYPFVDVDYFFLNQDGYVEKGAQSLDLKVYRKDYDLLRPEGGIGFGYTGCFHHVNLNFDVTASYIREQRFLGKKTKARFEDGPKKFTVRGLNPRNNLFGTGARLTITSTEDATVSFSFGYHGEFGEHFVENAGDAEVRIAF